MGAVPTGIADTGVLVHCGQPSISNCGRYQLNTDPFIPTGKKSNIFFSIGLVNIAPAAYIKRLHSYVRHAADKVHMVTGIKHNLLSMNQFAKAKSITFLTVIRSIYMMQQIQKLQFREAQF